MREALALIFDDLEEAIFTAAAVGILLGAIFVWSGVLSGALP